MSKRSNDRHRRKKERLLRLWLKDPKCHWCGRTTLYCLPLKGFGSLPEQATTEHLNSRLSGKRSCNNDNREKRIVLACYECNHKRGMEEVKKLYKNIHEERSKRLPRSFRQKIREELKMNLTEENKKYIDSLSYEALLSHWRFAPIGDAWFQGATGDYWGKRMNELRSNGADHVAASKKIGWDK